MNRKHVFEINEYYHVYNRGTDKRIIFLAKHDYHRFMLLLYFCNSNEPVDLQTAFREGRTFAEMFTAPRGKPLAAIGAWCLMPNHFHLLLHEKIGGGVSLFMQKLLTAYSTYFNKKHERSGGLFQGTFMATHVNNDEYLKYLLSYIHLNPVKIIDPKWKENGIADKVGAKKYLQKYNYSSYIDYIGQNRKEQIILYTEAFPEYFSMIKDFSNFIDEWLSFNIT